MIDLLAAYVRQSLVTPEYFFEKPKEIKPERLKEERRQLAGE